jgi:outer membrane protein OmpA-like peptidoglycan-associated protein
MPDALRFEATQPATGPIVLKGAVPDDTSAKALSTAAGGVATTGLTPDASLPADFVFNATTGLQALDTLVEGHLGFDGTKWYLRGTADAQAGKDAVNAKIAALPEGGSWSVGISVLAPLDACRVRVAALAKRNAIVFESGKAILAKSSMPVLDELATDVNICPAAFVHVQGYTDADGDADINLGLSVARAEAVVAELITRGVSESRLYAEGFGESEPIAPNDTKENKAKNRRIAFEIDEK